MKFYSPSTGGFYTSEIHTSMPDDAAEVSDADYRALFDAQEKGFTIEAGADGKPIAVAPAGPTIEQRIKSLTARVQTFLDEPAQLLGYDDLKSAIGYRGDPNPKFASEAEAFFVWRSAVWTLSNEIMAKVASGHMPEPDGDALVAMLPAFTTTK